jgi:rhodanese-related sulfurtransferase
MSAVTKIPAAPHAEAIAYFCARLTAETDVSDVAADLVASATDIAVVDARSLNSWQQGHIDGAVHMPTAEIAARAPELISRDVTVVAYCWGPGCNGATRAALEFARLGYRVKEMIGGYEYWVREGHPVVTATGVTRQPVDALTAPANGIACDC